MILEKKKSFFEGGLGDLSHFIAISRGEGVWPIYDGLSGGEGGVSQRPKKL